MKKVKDSQKRWKQLVTMLLVAALLVTGTPDVVGFASEGTQEQVTAAAEQSQKTQEKAQKESVQEETAQKEAVQDHEQMSEEAGGQQSSSSHSDTAVKEENTEKERSAAGTTERSETEEPQNNKQKNEVVSGAKSVAPSTSKVREPDKNEEKKEEKEEKDTKTEYIYKSASIYAKITLKDAEALSDHAELYVKQKKIENKIKNQIMNKAVGEENKQLVDSLKAYDFSFILSGERVDPSESMQVTLSNLGIKNTQNTLIYQMEEDGQVKKVDAVKTGSDAMQFMTKRLASYVILAYTTVSDIKGNDITTLYPAMITAAQTQIQSKENGNVPIEFWTRSKTPLVLKDKTGKKALEWTWSDIADIDLSLENDSQVWNGSRSYGKHIATSLKNGRVTAKDGKLYDSALWKNEGKAGKDTTITRIRGEFTITDKNRSKYAYTLKTVTDSENIYAKDNMFVFVYPKDTELTDNNYMDYLAFWTGASADAGTFHERTAAHYTQRTSAKGLSILTDGWHMTTVCNNAGSIIANTDANDYYIDVISTTESSTGGMYRFTLVKDTEGGEIAKDLDGTSKTKEAQSTEQTAKAASIIREYKSDEINVTVTAENETDLPEDAKLQVTAIEKDNKNTAEKYEDVKQQLIDKTTDKSYSIAGFLAYDISFVDNNGNKIEPNGKVQVSIEYNKTAIPEELKNDKNLANTAVTVMHLEEDEEGKVKNIVDMSKNKQLKDIQTNDDKEVKTVEFETESFSTFTITWTSNTSVNTEVNIVSESGEIIELQDSAFSGLKDNQKYYVEEIGVKSEEYDDIKINDVTYREYKENESEKGKEVRDIRTSKEVAENRRLVVFTNNCSAANKRELRITKAMQEGQMPDGTFSFEIYLTSTEGKLVPYVGPYYLYCVNDRGENKTETIYYKNENGKLRALESGKVEVAGDTDSTGKVAGIPVGYTVSITQILSGTKFKIKEIGLNNQEYKVPTITVSGCKDADTSKEYTAAGTIELGKDASVLVTNRKNYKVIKAEKQWKDSKKSDGTGEENSDFPDLEDDLKPESTILGLYYQNAAQPEQAKQVNATDSTNQWTCEFEVPGNHNLSDYRVREVVKKGENNYNLVDSEEYIKLGDYIYQVTYSEKTEITEGIEEKTVSVVNTLQRGSIEITKNNANKEKLGGAEFKITGLGNYEQTVTTPSGGENKGVITISDLLPGEYVITETKAPANYNLLVNPITAVVGTTEGESTNSGYTVVGDENTYYYDLKMEITNNKLFDMPAAGGGFRATIFGVVIMIIAGGWYGIRKRKRTI